MTRMLEALRRIEARKTDEAVEAALDRAETVTALAAACWDDGAPAGPEADAGPFSATIVQPVLPEHRPEACAMPPAEAEIAWQTPDAAPLEPRDGAAHPVARSGDRATTAGDRATTPRERNTTGDEPPGKRTRAFDRLAEEILSRVPAGGGAVLMFTSPLDGQGTAQLLSELAPLLARRGGEPLLIEGGIGGSDPARRLDELRGGDRLVLVDAGSLERPEVAPLSRHCDGSYLVLRPEQTPARALREAVRAIGACGGRLWGTVVVQP